MIQKPTRDQQYPELPTQRRIPAARLARARAAAAAGHLRAFLPDGAGELEDEALCRCGHLEADHRTDGRCSRCRRCRAPRCDVFWTRDRRPEDEVTVVDVRVEYEGEGAA